MDKWKNKRKEEGRRIGLRGKKGAVGGREVDWGGVSRERTGCNSVCGRRVRLR